MRIFLSYSHAQATPAAALATRLRADGHRVFHDVTVIPGGAGYDRLVRNEIGRCTIFLFLLSPDAVRPGSFAMAELELAQRRWPNPNGPVVPVELEPTPAGAIPPYLRAISILRPRGEPVTEVLALLAARKKRQLKKRFVTVFVTGGVGLALVAIAPRQRPQSSATNRTSANGTAADPGPAVARTQVRPSAQIDEPVVPSAQERIDPLPPAPKRPTPQHATVLPMRATASIKRRFFPQTHVCDPTIEGGPAEKIFLVCRCSGKDLPPDVESPGSIPLRLAEWDFAGKQARDWKCP